jgi:acyl-homoserine-lactone acylase
VNIYGANLVGLPGFGIAFNKRLGWSHTNNTLDNADSYELELRDGGYLLDGKVKPFDSRKKIIRIKNEQGDLIDREIDVLRSAHGYVVRREKDKAVAIRFPALDRADSGKQWYAMGKAANLQEFENALKMQQIPFWNVVYADRDGNIMYLFNGHVPRRGHGNWQYWDRIVPGGRSADIWTGVHTLDELPQLKNPLSGWLQNANDPPWSCTIPMLLSSDDYPSYMAPRSVPNYFRPQRSARMLAEDESITFDELASYKLSTRSEMADRLLDDLLAAVDRHGDDLAMEAKVVLQQWDRQANADSEGALLFSNWARKINPYDAATYRIALDTNRFFDTPDGFANPMSVVEQLGLAAKEVKTRWGKLNVPWGQAVRLRVGKYDLPANGADGRLGVFRVATPQPGDDGIMSIRSGDSWVAVIEFGERVRAKVLLSYGNASQPGSPHHGDQLQLFAKKQLRDAWFYRDDLEGHIARREILQDDRFVAVD